ncbi:uncharacterized protein N7483_006776 [Penicillium malachiteum]|uniref:uncharacterized protein n=1 Tax=Penicillium malachiteum TaxID=1324776 RepID=UPI002548DAF6|nr:uncharacterized protein N7483_006776 [Penicillium malachiteum]KAJ5725419.1 hypothetical protein N7483_006776 [Penicillium malachiteum]
MRKASIDLANLGEMSARVIASLVHCLKLFRAPKFLAVFAVENLVSVKGLDMILQSSAVGECASTILAYENLPEMDNIAMIVAGSFAVILFLTSGVFTMEFLSKMDNSEMPSKGIFPAEGFIAFGVFTLECLSKMVRIHMHSETNFIHKFIFTSRP